MSSSLRESTNDSHDRANTTPRVKKILEYIYGGSEGLNQALRSIGEQVSASTLQGCLPLLMQEVSAETMIARIGQEHYDRVRTRYREISLLNLWYSAELKQVLGTILEANIPVLILKGADVAATMYPRPDLRYFGDVDLMIHPKDLAATVALLEHSGYSYMQEYRFEAISKQRAGFVYVKAVAAGYLMIELHVSPHSNELGVSFTVADIWARARQIHVFDTAVLGMGLEDLLLYLCWHYRSHSFERLIWLYDVATVLQRCHDQLDWDLLYRLAYQQGLKATVYYVLHWCQQVFSLTIPEEAQLEKYAPPNFVQNLISRMIGAHTSSVLRRTARNDRKLLQHLATDTFRTLCFVELRTIFPSPTHLGRLYMEHSRLPLRLFWVYYFLHPLFALREAVKALFRTGKRQKRLT